MKKLIFLIVILLPTLIQAQSPIPKINKTNVVRAGTINGINGVTYQNTEPTGSTGLIMIKGSKNSILSPVDTSAIFVDSTRTLHIYNNNGDITGYSKTTTPDSGLYFGTQNGKGLGSYIAAVSPNSIANVISASYKQNEMTSLGIGYGILHATQIQNDTTIVSMQVKTPNDTNIFSVDSNAFIFQHNSTWYTLPQDTGSVGQGLVITANNGTQANLNWQDVPSTQFDTTMLAQSSSIALTTIPHTFTPGMYEVKFYLLNSVVDIGPATVNLTLYWNDGISARTITSSNLDCTTNGYINHMTGTTTESAIRNGSGTIQFSTSAVFVGVGQYELYITVEKL